MRNSFSVVFSNCLIWTGFATLELSGFCQEAREIEYRFSNFAGMPSGRGNADGIGTDARFNFRPYCDCVPIILAGIAVDSANNVFVADVVNGRIRKITPNGAVTTLATNAPRFPALRGLTVDAVGNIFAAD